MVHCFLRNDVTRASLPRTCFEFSLEANSSLSCMDKYKFRTRSFSSPCEKGWGAVLSSVGKYVSSPAVSSSVSFHVFFIITNVLQSSINRHWNFITVRDWSARCFKVRISEHMTIVLVDDSHIDGTKTAIADMIRLLFPHHWDTKFHTLDFARRPQAEDFN